MRHKKGGFVMLIFSNVECEWEDNPENIAYYLCTVSDCMFYGHFFESFLMGFIKWDF